MTQTKTAASEARQSGKPSKLTLANFYTLVRFVLTPVWVVLFVQGVWGSRLALYAAFAVAVIAMISDGLDGYYARKHKTTSDFGKLFDPLADAFFFVVFFLTFGVLNVVPIWLVLPFVARELLQHLYIRPTALRLGVTMGAKMIGKIKTGVQCCAGLLVIALEIVRSYDEQLIRVFHTDQLFAIFDLVAFGSVALAAGLSVASIVPYVLHLQRVREAASGEEKTDTSKG